MGVRSLAVLMNEKWVEMRATTDLLEIRSSVATFKRSEMRVLRIWKTGR